MKIEKILDLSWELTDHTPIYPGDPEPSIRRATCIKKEGYNLSSIYMGTQTGSHVDAPYHFSDEGDTIDQIPLEYFTGNALVIPILNKKADEAIYIKDIEKYIPYIKNYRIILFRTDWYKYQGSEEFFHHPYISCELAELLVERGVRFLCVDTINADKTGGTEFPVHELFSKKRLVIGENWANFDLIDFDNVFIIAFPLNIVNTDGSPVRALAMKIAE